MPCLEYSKYSEYLQKTNCFKSCLGDTFVMMMKRPQSAFRQQVCCGNGCHASPAFTANDCDCPVLFQISALQTGFPLSFIVFLQTISKFGIFFLLPVNFELWTELRISLWNYMFFRIGQRNSFGLINLIGGPPAVCIISLSIKYFICIYLNFCGAGQLGSFEPI